MSWRSFFKSNWYLGLISLSLVGCSNAKYTECQQIIEITNQVNRQTQDIIEPFGDRKIPKDVWSQAATMMSVAAEKIDNLSLTDPQLVDYQNNLVEMFRIYSQATDDAIKARESKNLKALESANEKAKKAGLLQEKLVMGINNYCLGQAVVE
ncbi:MAG: hypothetical protein QNJ70_27610 [Xenococcaceae cyanobacterium MO_207.B15]|nr:hypothetical protein [Xenococcaceae cyanobacterium MO_207.B15]